MKKFLKSKSLSFIVTCMFMVTFIVQSINVYSEEMLSYLPTGFTNVSIGKNYANNGNVNFDKDTKVLTVTGSGNQNRKQLC